MHNQEENNCSKTDIYIKKKSKPGSSMIIITTIVRIWQAASLIINEHDYIEVFLYSFYVLFIALTPV